MTRLFYVL